MRLLPITPTLRYTLSSKPPELIPFILWVAAGFPLAISTILILAIDLGACCSTGSVAGKAFLFPPALEQGRELRRFVGLVEEICHLPFAHIGTDMLPAIGLAYETKETAIMLRPPRRVHRDWLVDVPLMLFTYLHYGIIQASTRAMGPNPWGADC